MSWSNSFDQGSSRPNPFFKPNPFNSSYSNRLPQYVHKDRVASIIDHKIESLNDRNPFSQNTQHSSRASIRGGVKNKNRVDMFPKFSERRTIIKQEQPRASFYEPSYPVSYTPYDNIKETNGYSIGAFRQHVVEPFDLANSKLKVEPRYQFYDTNRYLDTVAVKIADQYLGSDLRRDFSNQQSPQMSRRASNQREQTFGKVIKRPSKSVLDLTIPYESSVRVHGREYFPTMINRRVRI